MHRPKEDGQLCCTRSRAQMDKGRKEVIKIHLPFPPSVNSLYPGNGKKRWKSKKYGEWIRLANDMLAGQKLEYFQDPVQVLYRIGRPDKRNRDLENYAKALSDLLVSTTILKDDSLIHRLVMEWEDIDGVDIEIVRMAETQDQI